MPIYVDMVISGIISKVINDYGDKLKKKIKDADKNRKSDAQNIETRIYQVIIDVLNQFTKNVYEGQDVLYDAAESILTGFKSGKNDSTEAVRTGLKMIESQITSGTCKYFLNILYHEICRDEDDILYKEISMIQQEQMSGNLKEGFKNSDRNHEETHDKLVYAIEGIDYIKENISSCEVRKEEIEIHIENRAEEYASKWDRNVFLNNFTKRDKNKGENVKLREIYQEEHLPHYTWKSDDEPFTDLKELLAEYIVDSDDKKMLLILGQPGIGKSTLITWVMANLVKNKNNIFVYQFARDLKNINWQGNDILNEIFNTLKVRYEELKNKVLILDGFDEIDTNNDRERILNKLNQDLKSMNYLKSFSLIMTCRENYIDELQYTYDYIKLRAWDENQIKGFYEIYEKRIARNNTEIVNNEIREAKINKIIENKEVFGIPLILYMILALNVDVKKSSSMVDIYDQIFSLKKGGIYDRCYDVEHRINSPKIKEYIHKVSQRIAFWIFENNSERASIPHKEFLKICDNVINETGERNESLQRDVLIGNYFTIIKHCEGIGTNELQFVHRSIYEYFVVVYFFESVCNLTSKEEVAGKLGELLKDGQLSEQILEFIKYKFSSMKKYDLPKVIKDIFNIMVRDGMTYHIKVEEPLNNVIEREKNIFLNMLKVVGLWNLSLGKLSNRIIIYLQSNRQNDLILRGIELGLTKRDIAQEPDLVLRELFISKENVFRVNLNRSYLRGADLRGADLSEADLNGADLRGADLSGADLSGADLSGANLSGANLRGANLRGINLFGAEISGTIFN